MRVRRNSADLHFDVVTTNSHARDKHFLFNVKQMSTSSNGPPAMAQSPSSTVCPIKHPNNSGSWNPSPKQRARGFTSHNTVQCATLASRFCRPPICSMREVAASRPRRFVFSCVVSDCASAGLVIIVFVRSLLIKSHRSGAITSAVC